MLTVLMCVCPAYLYRLNLTVKALFSELGKNVMCKYKKQIERNNLAGLGHVSHQNVILIVYTCRSLFIWSGSFGKKF